MSKQKDRVIKRKEGLPVISVILHRGGSGGGVIESVPSAKWLESMRVLRADGYMAYMRIAIDPSPAHEGYDGYPEFRLLFLPGNHDGLHNPTSGSPREIRVWGDNDLGAILPCFQSSPFIINTSLADLESLYRALGKTIRGAKQKKKKS